MDFGSKHVYEYGSSDEEVIGHEDFSNPVYVRLVLCRCATQVVQTVPFQPHLSPVVKMKMTMLPFSFRISPLKLQVRIFVCLLFVYLLLFTLAPSAPHRTRRSSSRSSSLSRPLTGEPQQLPPPPPVLPPKSIFLPKCRKKHVTWDVGRLLSPTPPDPDTGVSGGNTCMRHNEV